MASSLEKYPYPTEFNVRDFVPNKLSDRSNYDEWKELMVDFIESRGLLGFIHGKVKAPPKTITIVKSDGGGDSDNGGGGTNSNEIENEEYRLWKRSDALVRGWILTTLNKCILKKVLPFKTAEQVWKQLEQLELKFEPAVRGASSIPSSMASSLEKYPYPSEFNVGDFVPNKLSDRNYKQWKELMVDFIESLGLLGFIHGKVKAPPKTITIVKSDVGGGGDSDSGGDDTNSKEIEIEIENEEYKLWKRSDTLVRGWILTTLTKYILTRVLHSKTAERVWRDLEEIFDPVEDLQLDEEREIQLRRYQPLLKHAIKGDWDSASKFIEAYPDAVREDITVLEETALHVGIRSVSVQKIHFVKKLVEKMEPQDLAPTNMFGQTALHYAAGAGNVEATKLLVERKPNLTYVSDDEGRMPLHDAAARGRREVALYLLDATRQHHDAEELKTFKDKSGAQLLCDLARGELYDIALTVVQWYPELACMEEPSPLMEIAEKTTKEEEILRIMPMASFLVCILEVEKCVDRGARDVKNSDGMTPAEIFTDTHQELVKEGERWMKDTASSCTIVAALIATVVFAAAITVPGGNDNNSGHPIFSKQKALIIFGISDASALFSSITSVLMFLSILTARYAEEDFLYALPKRLIIGLGTLFISILSTMIAFGATLYLVFGDNQSWILIPIVALACIPVYLFAALQFPLLVEMIKSTYGRGLFGKQSDRMLF